MLLETKGLLSSSKRTKHINVRYFFIEDRIEKGDLSIEHCPTKDMLADFFTKPLPTKDLLKLQKLILDIKNIRSKND